MSREAKSKLNRCGGVSSSLSGGVQWRPNPHTLKLWRVVLSAFWFDSGDEGPVKLVAILSQTISHSMDVINLAVRFV
jgi:hypothetical protein